MPRRPRHLSPSERAAVLAASKGSIDDQRAWARDFDRETFDAWAGWTWGRKSFDLRLGVPDEIPSSGLVAVLRLEVTEYIAKKRDPDGKARRAVYRHEHDRPFAVVATTREGAAEMLPGVRCRPVSSRGAPRWRGPALFGLGELYALEGTAADGGYYHWRAPRGVLLTGCPHFSDLHAIRQGAARRSGPPIWVLRSGSRYLLTDRGIER